MGYKETVREKLDRIDGLYPPERLEKSKERWRRLWANEPPLDRRPFTCAPVTLGYWDSSPREQRLIDYLDEFICRGEAEDDFVPGMFAGCHQGGMASMFGAKTFEIYNEGVMDTNCERLLCDIDGIAGLQAPGLLPESVPYRWLNDDKWYMDVTDGRLPIHCVDCFGPLEIAGKLIGYDLLFAAAYEAPELYDRLMNLAADAFIMFWDAQQALCGDLFVTTALQAYDWVPQNMTNALGMDGLVMLSPDFFRERTLPYIKRIADRYGPITIHSCGWFKQLIPAICETPLINGLHVSQMTLAELADAGLDDNVVAVVYTNPDAIASDTKFAKERGFRLNVSVGGLWKDNDPSKWDAADIRDVKERVKRIVPYFYD